MALTWGVAWAVPGLLAGVPQWILVGLISGAGFSVVLGIAERRHRLEELSLPRVAGWGAVGAVGSALVAMPLLLLISGGALAILPFLAVVAALGAGSAAGTLAIARGADARESLEPGEGARLPPELR
jgi:hypothetical protein